MTLEDFFTLTEMKGGLASLSRVEELVSLMRHQKDYVIKNLGDTARQWSTVAHIISVTQNSDCLNHFIQLNGMWFLDQWLQEAQRGNDDTTESYIEELIKALLRAIEKLLLDNRRSTSSGIGITVKHLCGHKSLGIQERAKALLESWNNFGDTDTKQTWVEECSETPVTDASSRKTAGEGTFVAESAASDFQHLSVAIISDGFTAHGGKAPIVNKEAPQTTSDKANAKIGSSANGKKSSGTTSNEVSVSLVPRDRAASKKADEISELKDLSDAKDRMEIEMDASEDKMSESSLKKTASTSLGNNNVTEEHNPKTEDVRSGSSGNGGMPRKRESPGSSPLQGLEAPGTLGDGKEVARELGSKISIESSLTPIGQSDALVLRMDWRDSEVMDGKPSGTVLGYEEDDALEVARKVAQEVEREVETNREEPLSSSSSEKDSEGEPVQSSSPDSVQGKQEEPTMVVHNDRNETPIEADVQDGGPLKGENNLDRDYIKPEDHVSVAVAQASVPETDQGRCIFDLNEDVHAEEGECAPLPFSNPLGNLSAPVAIIGASKGALGLPATPLHFEGELGWRGSAATSAFRPASPWKTLDNEKTFSVEASKQRQNFLKIDLNIAGEDGDDEAVMDLMSARHVPVSASVPSGDDSIEVTSRREERLKLDLNRLGDNEDVVPDWRVDGRSHRYQNGNRSPSPASSSSSRQPSMIDIDLNDNPSFFDTSPHTQQNKNEKSSQLTNAYKGFKLDGPIISMMGPRMEIDRMEFTNSAHSFLVNGQGTFSTMSRVGIGAGSHPALAYAAPPPPPFGYNAIGMGPPMSLSQAVYAPGPVPYMVDSRGATVIPQIMGSPAAVSSSFTRPPFIMSTTGSASSHINGIGRVGLDLNSGMGSTESTGRESGSLRQLFIQGHNGLMEDQVKSGSQISGSGATLKRKEPECGWDQYALGFKQAASWN